jgi:hypothetical protein
MCIGRVFSSHVPQCRRSTTTTPTPAVVTATATAVYVAASESSRTARAFDAPIVALLPGLCASVPSKCIGRRLCSAAAVTTGSRKLPPESRMHASCRCGTSKLVESFMGFVCKLRFWRGSPSDLCRFPVPFAPNMGIHPDQSATELLPDKFQNRSTMTYVNYNKGVCSVRRIYRFIADPLGILIKKRKHNNWIFRLNLCLFNAYAPL